MVKQMKSKLPMPFKYCPTCFFWNDQQ